MMIGPIVEKNNRNPDFRRRIVEATTSNKVEAGAAAAAIACNRHPPTDHQH